jgi:metal-sulfur cluster biosynthetic enzyme
MAVTVEQVKETLKQIFDPEIHINIMDLGLVYGVDVLPQDNDKAKVNVRLTLTSPACPYGPQLLSKTHADLAAMPGVSDVNLDLVWIPQWDPRKMASEEAKMQMGIFDFDDEDEKGSQAEKKES